MVLSNFIRRNHGKRKANKVTESRLRKKSFSVSESSQAAVASPLVFDINEESLAAQSSPLVELNLPYSNEEWFPQDLLRRRSHTPSEPSSRAQNGMANQENLAQERRADMSPVPSLSHSDSASSVVTSHKKSIPAPIMIPDHLLPNVQIGRSAAPTGQLPTTKTSHPNTNDASLNQPSPSASENLSSISGTTLARALIGSSFVLSSENRNSRHRSGVARQDSATLPRSSFVLSNSRSSSPIPPVPPVPVNLVTDALSPDSNHPSTSKSGASTESEYPMSDSCITSSEIVGNSVIPRRIDLTQDFPSPEMPEPTEGALPAGFNAKSQQKVGPVPTRTRGPKNSSVLDVPETTVTVEAPVISQEASRCSSVLLSSDDHSLDEFDFLPPDSSMLVASPESESNPSCVVHAAPPFKRPSTNHGQWKRRPNGVDRNGSKVSLVDNTFASQQAHDIPSSSTSDLDYGELLHCDLTVSPGSSLSSSSVSAGYQTFPETPVVFSPLGSSGYGFFVRSDSQVLRKRISSMRSVGRGSAKMRYHLMTARRQVGNNDGGVRRSQSSSLPPRQKTLSQKQDETVPTPSLLLEDAVVPEDEMNQSPTPNKESQHTGELLTADRPHPLARVSSSSSYVLEEEALRVLAKHSSSLFPSITIVDIDPSFDPTVAPVSDAQASVKTPASIPLPDSTDVPPFNSPALTGGTIAVSPGSPLRSSLPTTSTAVSQPESSKSLLFPPTPSLRGSSFLPLTSSPSSVDEALPHTNFPIPNVSSAVAPDEPSPRSSHSPSPSFVPPPPYHAIVLERTARYPSCSPSLSGKSSAEPIHLRSRQASNSSLASGATRTRGRPRPPLPVGPRKPNAPGQASGSFFPLRARNASVSSVGSTDPPGSPPFPWHRLHAAASKPPPKFHTPPPKWRGLTLEAAQWTFTSAQLQQVVSQAIQQSSEGSALRFLRPEVLEGEIADELQRLELQHMDAKSQFKALSRKRWILFGALAGCIEEAGDAALAARTLEELAEVCLALDRLTDKMHDTVLHMAQLKSLRDVHNTSALAMAVRKINDLFVRQMVEKEHLQGQVDALCTERDEAWKHAEDIAQDYDTLNDRVTEGACGDGKASNTDAASSTGSRRSTRISAKRKSSIRLSEAGLRSRSRSRHRTGRSPSNATRPSSLALDDIPPVPRLPVNPSMGSSALTLPSAGMPFGSAYGSTPGMSAALALAEAQREVYEMLGLSLPPSQASSRRRTLSSTAVSRPPSPKSRPASESLDTRGVRRVRSRREWSRLTRSAVVDDLYHIRPLAVAHG